MNSQKVTLNTLAEWERVAFEYEHDVLEAFCYNAHDLAGISFSSGRAHVTYVLSTGQHISDSIDMDQWLEFYHSKIENEAIKALKRAFE